MLKGKHILIGVTGGIAAYKTATIIRLLVKDGAEVKVIMTEHAKEFITPLTLATLAKNPVLTEFYNPVNGDWNSHVDLGLWADLFLIAPATANTIAKMANGVADNLLLTTYLSARCPIFVAPSMDMDMLKHPATTINTETLKAFGNSILEPSSGELASGLHGKGRMAEPEEIVEEIKIFFTKKKTYKPLREEDSD
jgi:phosphopantothenoylcysteine decarboxylase/phosphopantothenate--cysteine ligase